MYKIEKLTISNVESYIDYLKTAFKEDKDMMIADSFDSEGVKNRINDPFYQNTYSLLAFDGNKVIGRLEYHFYGCLQDGYRMCYVDWVYVLPKYRHKGVAKLLFINLEETCIENKINQYYLIRSTNDSANKFYSSFKDVTLNEEPTLRKQF